MKDFMDNEETLKEGEETTSAEEASVEVVEETTSVEAQEVEVPTKDSGSAPTAEKANFFKQLWQKIVANKVISIAVAATLVVGSTAAILITSLSGGGNNPPIDNSNSSTTSTTSSSTNDSSSVDSSEEESPICTVTFESNGGTVMETITVERGAVIDLRDYMPIKANSYFYGWCSDAALTTRVDAFYMVQGNATLYAEWGTDETYVLTFETNGGSTIESVSYRPNAYLLEPAAPTKENYAFAGWYKDAACTKEFSFFTAPQMPKSNLTIYAKWVALNGFVFETNGGSEVEPIYGTAGDLVGEIATPTKEGKIFEGW